MLGRRFKKRSRMRVAAWPSPCPAPGPEPRHAALVRVASRRREAAQDAHGSDSGEHRKVVTVHSIFQSSLPDLVEAVKVERNPAPVRENQPVEAHGQPGLILVRHGQHRAGKVTGELRDERRFEE